MKWCTIFAYVRRKSHYLMTPGRHGSDFAYPPQGKTAYISPLEVRKRKQCFTSFYQGLSSSNSEKGKSELSFLLWVYFALHSAHKTVRWFKNSHWQVAVKCASLWRLSEKLQRFCTFILKHSITQVYYYIRPMGKMSFNAILQCQ